MKNTNKLILTVLHIIAWIIFIGLCIEAGGLIVNFLFSLFRPEFIPRLYQKLDLTALHKAGASAFFCVYSFILTLSILKACLFYVVIRLMLRLDLSKPFNDYAARQISLISYCTLSVGLVSYLARQYDQQLMHRGFDTVMLNQFWADSQAYILMGAVIYIIAVIFKKGVDVQTENELTV